MYNLCLIDSLHYKTYLCQSAVDGWTHGGGGGDLEVHGLEDEVGGAGQLDDLAAHQTQLLVVVQHRVHVLNPDGVHRAVKYQPLPVGGLREKTME